MSKPQVGPPLAPAVAINPDAETGVAIVAPPKPLDLSAAIPALGTVSAAVITGIVATLLTQRMIRGREDRARAIQQKREAFVGALTAWHDHVRLERECAELAIRAKRHNEHVQAMQAASAKEEMHFARKLRAEALNETTIKAVVRNNDFIRGRVEFAQAQAFAVTEKQIETVSEGASAVRRLDYWAAMLDVTCDEGTTQAYHALAEGTSEGAQEREAAFVAAFKDEQKRNEREGSALGWILTALWEPRRRARA